jgi:hypothetical protein
LEVRLRHTDAIGVIARIGCNNKNANEAGVQDLHEKCKITDFQARSLTHHSMIFGLKNALKFTYGHL